ncbi:beta-propeller fold lactonase family protein [Alteromonas sp. HB246098]
MTRMHPNAVCVTALTAASFFSSLTLANTPQAISPSVGVETVNRTTSSDNTTPLVPMATFPIDNKPLPRFSVDASWPSLPETWMLGQVSGLSIDKYDHVWILQRPNSLGKTDTGLAATPSTAVCCEPAPHVIRFTPNGEVDKAWGGESNAPTIDGVNQWPVNVHGLFVDENDTVWLAGNGKDDHVSVGFTFDGEFVKGIGRRGQTNGNMDLVTLGNPADMFMDSDHNELVIADGYINARIASFDVEKERATHVLGAYGEKPLGPTREGDFDQSQATQPQKQGIDPENPLFGNIVHCINQDRDGFIYVCDRRNNRLQIFKREKSGDIRFVKNFAVRPETGGLGTATDVAFSPDGKYLYVADMMNGRIWIYDRKSHEKLGSIGKNGRYPGQFIWLHSIDTDSEGNLYTTEVNTGRRVQKLAFQGVK